MSKTYEPAPKSVSDQVIKLLLKFHPDLAALEPQIDCVFASTDSEDGHAVKLHGSPCYAVVRIIGLKDRVMGRGDAEIVIDRKKFEAMSPERQNALLDHELYHLVPKEGQDGEPRLDDRGRPTFKMRPHDHEYGWFDEIARRHGIHAIEVQQAKAFVDGSGQFYLVGFKPAAAA